jgi:hypothetical protein
MVELDQQTHFRNSSDNLSTMPLALLTKCGWMAPHWDHSLIRQIKAPKNRNRGIARGRIQTDPPSVILRLSNEFPIASKPFNDFPTLTGRPP